MKVDVRDSEGTAWRKVLAIEVPAEELAEDYAAILEDYQNGQLVPGFRKGRVPPGTCSNSNSATPSSTRMQRAVKRSYDSGGAGPRAGAGLLPSHRQDTV